MKFTVEMTPKELLKLQDGLAARAEEEEVIEYQEVGCACGEMDCEECVILTTEDAELFETLGLEVVSTDCDYGVPEGYEPVQDREDYTIVRPVAVTPTQTEAAPVPETELVPA